MTNIKESAEDLAKMVSEGKLLEAFEKYYADNIVMQENEDAPRIGKEDNRKAEQAFVGGITKINEIKTLGLAFGDDYSTYESYFNVEHKDWGHIEKKQVAVQHWKDGKIVSEKFYYNTK